MAHLPAYNSPLGYRTELALMVEPRFKVAPTFGDKFTQDGIISIQTQQRSKPFSSKTIFGTREDVHYLNTVFTGSIDVELTRGRFLNQLLYLMMGARAESGATLPINTVFQLQVYQQLPTFRLEFSHDLAGTPKMLIGCVMRSMRLSFSANDTIVKGSFEFMAADLVDGALVSTVEYNENELPYQPFRTDVFIDDAILDPIIDQNNRIDRALMFDISVARNAKFGQFSYQGIPSCFVHDELSVTGNIEAILDDPPDYYFLDNTLKSVVLLAVNQAGTSYVDLRMSSVRFGDSTLPIRLGNDIIKYRIPFVSVNEFGSGRILKGETRLV